MVVALLEVCDVTKHGSHLGSHLGFYQKLNSGKNSKNKQFLRLTCKITKIITLHHFITNFTFMSEKVEKTYFLTQKRLDHLLLMTSYLVNIVTDYH